MATKSPATDPRPTCTWQPPPPVGVPPARCLVVEDTVTGVAAGVAAGATVVGYSLARGPRLAEALRAAGAVRVIADMGEL